MFIKELQNNNIIDCNDINIEQPTFIIFGGGKTDNYKAIEIYAHIFDRFFRQNNLQNKQIKHLIALYEYKYTMFDKDDAYLYLFYKHNKKVEKNFNPNKLNEETKNPNYIRELFDKIFLPRITQKDGTRLPINIACSNLRKITLFCHCHGSFVFAKTEDLLIEKMLSLGYTQKEIDTILAELVVIVYAPFMPIDKHKATIISFCSINDNVLKLLNYFKDAIKYLNSKNKIENCFFDGNLGNIFISQDFNKKDLDEHWLIKFNPKTLKPNGRIVSKLLQEALKNALLRSINNKSITNVFDLIKNEHLKKILKEAKLRGFLVYKQMINKKTRKRIKYERKK